MTTSTNAILVGSIALGEHSPGCSFDAVATKASDKSTSAAHNRKERISVLRAMTNCRFRQVDRCVSLCSFWCDPSINALSRLSLVGCH